MKNIYACPHCATVLNPSVKVLLMARHHDRRGMILLSPQPGNFKYICDPSLEEGLKPGELVAFSCPVCTLDLTSVSDHRFAELVLRSPGHRDRKIEFSRAFGTHATYVIDGQSATAFGEDADEEDATNFFGS